MEYLYERVAYLRGLCEGLGIAEETKEGRVLGEIVEILGEFADAIVELSDKQDELEEYTESIDEDLSDLEDDFYEDEDEDEDDDDDEMGYVEVMCPHCGEEIEIDEDLLYDEESDILCPCCDQVIMNACDDEDDDEEIEEEKED